MARQRLKEVRLELIVGSFVFIVFLMLGAFTIMLTRENIFRKRYPVSVLFNDISTLRVGDNVVVRGMPVGKIKELDLKRDGVKVVCSLDERLDIREDYKVRIISTSMLGGKALQIDQGSTNAPKVDEDARLIGTEPVDLMDEASEAVAQIRRALEEGGIIRNIEGSAASLNEIMAKINTGEGLLGRLINDAEMANDFKVLSGQLKAVAERIERKEGTLGRLLSEDDSLYTNLAATVASLKSVSERVEKGEGTIGRLLSSDDTIYRDLQSAVASVKSIAERVEKGEGLAGKLFSPDDTMFDDLRATVASLKSTAEKIDTGVGTLGKLINEDVVYQDLKATVSEARAMIDDLRETAPVTSFGSLLIGSL